MASQWEKVAGSRNRTTKANKSLFLKTGVASPHNQFKIQWQWSKQKTYQKTLSDMSSALEFYEGIRIAIPTSEWDKIAKQENSQLLKQFLEDKLAEKAEEGTINPPSEKRIEASKPKTRETKNHPDLEKNEEKIAA